MGLFTIGHSTLTLEEFFRLLGRHGVDLLVDVRSSPYSAHVPQFNREPLESEANARGVSYRYLGLELGGRPRRPDLETEGQPDYEKMGMEPALIGALQKVVQVAEERNVVLMCSEGDPSTCHRAKLLGRVLIMRYSVEVQHITRQGVTAQLDLLPEQTTLF